MSKDDRRVTGRFERYRPASLSWSLSNFAQWISVSKELVVFTSVLEPLALRGFKVALTGSTFHRVALVFFRPVEQRRGAPGLLQSECNKSTCCCGQERSVGQGQDRPLIRRSQSQSPWC